MVEVKIIYVHAGMKGNNCNVNNVAIIRINVVVKSYYLMKAIQLKTTDTGSLGAVTHFFQKNDFAISNDEMHILMTNQETHDVYFNCFNTWK